MLAGITGGGVQDSALRPQYRSREESTLGKGNDD